MKRHWLGVCVAFGLALPSGAQEARFHSPVDIPFLMSGNFGEPRPNHFHCGIDVKTQGVTGKRILSVCDGYVSRLTVGYDGFGNAAYVTHPNGLVSVYCHLDRFIPALQERVRRRQYEEESERVDVRFSPEEFPVKAGDLIAYSGNTGASQAPHLHLELHRASDGALVDPLPYFRHLAEDTMNPVVHGVKLYPCPGEGLVDGAGRATTFTVTADASARVVKAWGKVGAGVWTDDRMDHTYNKFGIWRITLNVDGRQVFQSVMDEFLPGENPWVNFWGDYAHFRKTRHWYLKSFVEPGNTLQILSADEDRGWVDINEERDYRFEYTLEDLKGNKRVSRFTVRGVRDDAGLAREAERERRRMASGSRLLYDRPNVVQGPGMELRIPVGALDGNKAVNVKIEVQEDGLSNRYTLHDDFFPLAKRATLMLAPRVPLERPEKGYIESSRGYVGGEYRDGWYMAQIRDLGESYALAVDTVAPRCKWLTAVNGQKLGVLRCSPSDKESGLESFKAYVDGQFVLFTSYRGVWTCRLKDTPLEKEGKRRQLVVKLTDRCGNEKTETKEFIY